MGIDQGCEGTLCQNSQIQPNMLIFSYMLVTGGHQFLNDKPFVTQYQRHSKKRLARTMLISKGGGKETVDCKLRQGRRSFRTLVSLGDEPLLGPQAILSADIARTRW